MKTAIYTRVSTSDQNAENQVTVLAEWAKRRGYEAVKTYQEEESAWKSGHQRVLAALVEDARRGKFQVVLVWALDRLSREGARAILSLVYRLSTYGEGTVLPGELDRGARRTSGTPVCVFRLGCAYGKSTEKRKNQSSSD